ncbi:hypothetical protein POM88_008946 [Heracleum sosnowskyi]|uniref:Uncharacterized protein n=1 Tax=Heracleum sosnowskyi TaxID=360622 RepID=A0AAD8J867_9APIA|nr:hypothetical protein POM88_008946 [Heracleum sosnowskyi]
MPNAQKVWILALWKATVEKMQKINQCAMKSSSSAERATDTVKALPSSNSERKDNKGIDLEVKTENIDFPGLIDRETFYCLARFPQLYVICVFWVQELIIGLPGWHRLKVWLCLRDSILPLCQLKMEMSCLAKKKNGDVPTRKKGRPPIVVTEEVLSREEVLELRRLSRQRVIPSHPKNVLIIVVLNVITMRNRWLLHRLSCP